MKRVPLILACVAAAAFVSAFALIAADALNAPKIAEYITVEAGDDVPGADVFLLTPKRTAQYASGAPSDTYTVGEYAVTLAVDGDRRVYDTKLIVADTVAPQGEPVACVTVSGYALPPASFVKNIDDATEVAVTFSVEPDFTTPGDREVSVLLTDAGGNTAIVVTDLRVYAINMDLTVEAGSGEAAELTLFNAVYGLRFEDASLFRFTAAGIDDTVLGAQNAPLTVGSRITFIPIAVVDTVDPIVQPRNLSAWLGETPDAERFVRSASDATPLTYSYAEEPDWTLEGTQDVAVDVTDAGGNVTRVTAALTLVRDTEPPVISGELNRRVFVGTTVSYREGVTVRDNGDSSVRLNIDSTAVNLNAEGEYTVTYSARDWSGNYTEVTGTVTVYSATEDDVYVLADNVLAQIINDTMTQYEQVRKIHTWVRTHVAYRTTGRKDGVLNAAFNGFKVGAGDCYTYYALCEVLLNRAGIDNIPLQRLGGRTKHFWCLVNVGDGWYHLDATPFRNSLSDGFMMTQTRVEELTRTRGNNYYVYDATGLPEVVS